MPEKRTPNLPSRLHPVLDDLFRQLVAEGSETLSKEQDKDRVAWKRTVAVELASWKKRKPASSGAEDVDHAALLLALESLSERIMLRQGQDIQSALTEKRLIDLVGLVDAEDWETYKRCEIDLERPTVISTGDDVPRDEILRRWSRARQRMQEAIRQA
ncbi:MAG: hypothetical protein H6834_11425 [Planctomycetes bacterium]|nr:hypothetical protein [Planctomycetota bacterium]